MATKTIKLREQLHQWVEMQANLGGFADTADYVEHVLNDERRRLNMESLEAQLLESLQSGPATDFTDKDWKDLRHLARTGERRPA